jgi:hypothetical protein
MIAPTTTREAALDGCSDAECCRMQNLPRAVPSNLFERSLEVRNDRFVTEEKHPTQQRVAQGVYYPSPESRW